MAIICVQKNSLDVIWPVMTGDYRSLSWLYTDMAYLIGTDSMGAIAPPTAKKVVGAIR